MFDIVDTNVKQGNFLHGHLLNDRLKGTQVLIKIETFFHPTEYSDEYQWSTLNEKWIDLDTNQEKTSFSIQIPNHCPISYGLYADTKQRILITCENYQEELFIYPDLLFHQLMEDIISHDYVEVSHTPCCIMPRSSRSFIQPFWFRRSNFLFYIAFAYKQDLSPEDEMLTLYFFARNEKTSDESAVQETFYKRIPYGTIPSIFEQLEYKVL